MKVSEVMSRDVKIASPDDTVQSAAQLMSDEDFGVLPVGENDRLVGMLTDRDIVVRAVAQGKPSSAKLRDVMSSDVKYVFDDQSVEEAASVMSELQIRRLPVLSRDKRLVGIVSLGDVALKKKAAAGEALEDISKPG